MAVVTGSFLAKSIFKVTQYGIVLPNDGPGGRMGNNPHYERDTKLVILLHGLTANCNDWIHSGHLQELSWQYNVVFVTASGDNSFYLNGGFGNYDEFIGVELLDYIRKTYHVPMERENTIIAGQSMGGYGALHVGLSHPENFSAIFGLSNAILINNVHGMQPGQRDNLGDYTFYSRVFGDLSTLKESDNNLEVLLAKHKAAGTELPKMYLTVGTEDFLLQENRDFKKFLDQENIPHTYVEKPGGHTWDFWNPAIKDAIEWL